MADVDEDLYCMPVSLTDPAGIYEAIDDYVDAYTVIQGRCTHAASFPANG